MAQVALAWVLGNPVVVAPVIVATNVDHLDDAAAALNLQLTGDDHHRFTTYYTPRQPTGY